MLWGIIEHLLSGHCLEIEGNSYKPLTQVILGPKNFYANQLWRYTPEGYIESKHGTNLVLDVMNNNLVINQKSGADSQKWLMNGRFICSQANGNVIGTAGESKAIRATVIVCENNLASHLQWQWIVDPEWVYIKSIANDMVLSVKEEKLEKGTFVVMLPPNNHIPSQLWGFMPDGTIASKLGHNFVLDVHVRMNSNEDVVVNTRHEPLDPRQVWTLEPDGTIKNKLHQLVLDIEHARADNGATVKIYGRNEKPNQKWILEKSAM